MRWRVVEVVTMVLLAATACAIPMADLGGATSAAIAINDAGVVVGTSQRPDGSWGAFKRLPNDTVIELATLPGATNTTAVAINDVGVVAGTVSLPVGPRAVFWSIDGSIHEACAGNALEIDDAGRLLVDCEGTGVFDPVGGQLITMPLIPEATGAVSAGFNDLGQVVGWQFREDGAVPVRWDSATNGVVDLSNSLSDASFLPTDINDAGSMIGFVPVDPDAGDQEAAVVLAGSDEVVRLGAGAHAWSQPWAINEFDVVVGAAEDADGSFRWQPATGLVWLPKADAWAGDINDEGTVVGSANGRAAFLSFPSTP